MIETHLMETFVAVVRQGSVTAAAQSLQKSQPAISHRLRQLEDAFGIALFEKVGRRLQLTDAGRRLLDEVVELLDRIESLPRRVLGGVEHRGTVTVGTFPTLGRYRLLPALERVLSEQPDVKLVFKYDDTATLRADLVRGNVDIIVVAGELDKRGLDVVPMGKTRASVGVASDAEIPRGLSSLREQRYLGWRDAIDPIFGAIESWALSKNLVGSGTPEIPDIESLRALAASGVGWVCLPDYVLADDERLIAIDAPGLRTSFPIRMATRKGLVTGSAAHWVRDVLREA